MTFAALGLSDELVRAVSERGYTEPTPIQAQAIPAVLSGGDLLAGAQTGTGKTAGFTLPILQRLATSAKPTSGKAPIRVLVLIPTRELAAQVEESVRNYGKYLKFNSMTMIGGVNINPQINRLKSRVDILVATPGRLLDHLQQKTVDLSHVEILVLDEADRMLTWVSSVTSKKSWRYCRRNGRTCCSPPPSRQKSSCWLMGYLISRP